MFIQKGKNMFQDKVDLIVAEELTLQQINQQMKVNEVINQNKDSLSMEILNKKQEILNRISVMVNNGENTIAMPLLVIGNADLELGKETLNSLVSNIHNDLSFEYDVNIIKSGNDVYVLIVSASKVNEKVKIKGLQK